MTLRDQVLDDQIGFEVRWAIAGTSIVTQLVARLNEGQYMAFGLSGDEERSRWALKPVTDSASPGWLEETSRWPGWTTSK